MKSTVILLFLLIFCNAIYAQSPSLVELPSSIELQGEKALELGFLFIETVRGLEKLIDEKLLVEILGDKELYVLYQVSFPFALPRVKVFIDLLAQDYLDACDEQLVVTSLTRPMNRQLDNARPYSVHPTGMAFDMWISENPTCTDWLETKLLFLEGKNEIEATEEKFPPHYHVAVFGEYR